MSFELKNDFYNFIMDCKRDFIQIQKEEHKVRLYKEE